jgi:hypothetical protein
MHRNVSLKRYFYATVAGACLLPTACAHGVELDFNPYEGDGGTFTSGGGRSGVTTGNPGPMGGAAGASSGAGMGGNTGEGGSSAGAAGSGGTGGGTGGGSGGSGGATATATGGAGPGGSAGAAGGVPDAGQAGSGAGGSAGAGGSSGAGGTGGRGGGGAGGGGASGAKPDAGVDSGLVCPADVGVSGNNASFGHGSRQLGDVLFTDNCPAEEVVIGYSGAVDTRAPASIGRIQTRCGSLSITKGASCQVTITPTAPLPTRGTTGTVAFEQLCPANQVVVEFHGQSSLVLDRVGFTCAPLTITRAGASYNLSLGATTTTTEAGGTGGSDFTEPCPTGQIARGTNTVTYTGFVNAFGIICGTPALR